MRLSDWWFWFRHHDLPQLPDKLCRWLAWRVPRRLALWCFYRIGTELDPDAMTREGKAIDIVGDWARYHGLQK